jgi:hypothetical protein
VNSPKSPTEGVSGGFIRCITVDYNEVCKQISSGKLNDDKQPKSLNSGHSLHKPQTSIAGTSVFDPFLTSIDYTDELEFRDDLSHD